MANALTDGLNTPDQFSAGGIDAGELATLGSLYVTTISGTTTTFTTHSGNNILIAGTGTMPQAHATTASGTTSVFLTQSGGTGNFLTGSIATATLTTASGTTSIFTTSSGGQLLFVGSGTLGGLPFAVATTGSPANTASSPLFLQAGSGTCSSATLVVAYPKPFTGRPSVYIQPLASGALDYMYVTADGTGSFTANSAVLATREFLWQAIGVK